MTRSVRIHELGGPGVLRIEDVTVSGPGVAEMRSRIRAAQRVTPIIRC